MQFARFLLALVDRGPTAAAGFFSGTVWLNKYIGFTFPTGSPSLEDFRRPEGGHQATQATSLEPWEFFKIYTRAQASEPTSILYSMLLFTAIACLRFEHLSISTRHSSCSGFLRGYIPRGKRVVKGTRPGYPWCLPRHWGAREDSLGHWATILLRDAAGASPGALPDIDTSGQGIAFLQRPMSYFRSIGLLTRALGEIGSTRASASFNVLRRFMPSARLHFAFCRTRPRPFAIDKTYRKATGKPRPSNRRNTRCGAITQRIHQASPGDGSAKSFCTCGSFGHWSNATTTRTCTHASSPAALPP